MSRSSASTGARAATSTSTTRRARRRSPPCATRSTPSCPGTAASIAGAASSRRSRPRRSRARAPSCARFVGGRPGDGVVFVRNTTEAVNVLAAALPAGTRVLATAAEHHANLLPWRRHRLRLLPCPDSPEALLDGVERALRRARRPIRLVAVTGASNVTGEVWPLARAGGARAPPRRAAVRGRRPARAAPADRHGRDGHRPPRALRPQALRAVRRRRARRRPRRARATGRRCCAAAAPSSSSRADDVIWAGGPERHEAGSPNVIGVVALAAACRALARARHGRRRRARARALRPARGRAGRRPRARAAARCGPARAATASACTRSRSRACAIRCVAAVLSAEHGIGVRHGCFCAHLLIARLLGVADAEVERLGRALRAGGRPELPGAVRASLGLGTTQADLDRLVAALHGSRARGPGCALPPRRRARRVRARGGRPRAPGVPLPPPRRRARVACSATVAGRRSAPAPRSRCG